MTDTFARIRTVMEQAKAQYEREVKLYAEVRRILAEKFTGKRVDTKHTINYIQKVKPTWTASLQGVSNHTNLRVWGGDSGFKDWNDYGRIMLGYNNELYHFDPDVMDKHNLSIESCKREIVRIEEVLKHPTAMAEVANAIDAYNDITKKTLELIGNYPESSALKNMAGLNNKY